MTFKDALKRKIEDAGLMRKLAAAVLTPEAEQAAVQGGMGDPAAMAGGMPPGGAPMDPAMMGGAPMPPGAPMPGAPAGAPPQGSGGGQLPPEIMQDQGFMQWLQQMGIMFDPQSGMFYDPQGQPLPADVIVQAYQQYQMEMQGAAAPQGGAPMDPAAMGGAPVDPAMQGAGAPPEGGAPSEALQDPAFVQMLQQMGAQVDPATGTVIDPMSGQPMPPEVLDQAYQAYQQQMGGAPAPDAAAAPEAAASEAAPMDAAIPQEVLDQIQSVVDASIENFSAQLDKKFETLIDKLETVKLALEAMRDTDDQRDKEDKEATRQLQDEIAAELQPTVKEASAKPQAVEAPKPINMFEFIINSRKNK